MGFNAVDTKNEIFCTLYCRSRVDAVMVTVIKPDAILNLHSDED
jgi:hypothetical protein